VKLFFYREMTRFDDGQSFMQFVDFYSDYYSVDDLESMSGQLISDVMGALVEEHMHSCGAEGPWTIYDSHVINLNGVTSATSQQYVANVILENPEDSVKLKMLSNIKDF
jgi:hypothetical protein